MLPCPPLLLGEAAFHIDITLQLPHSVKFWLWFELHPSLKLVTHLPNPTPFCESTCRLNQFSITWAAFSPVTCQEYMVVHFVHFHFGFCKALIIYWTYFGKGFGFKRQHVCKVKAHCWVAQICPFGFSPWLTNSNTEHFKCTEPGHQCLII